MTRNAIEAISYQQLSQSRCEYTPPGLVVSADAELPPPWLVDWVIKSKKKLFLATKTQLTPDDIAKALPQLVMNGQFIGSYETDVSNAPSWHDLLIERINFREMPPGIDSPTR